MTFRTKYVFVASMDVDPEREDLFNEVYDREHVPLLKTVPGVVSVARLVAEPLTSSRMRRMLLSVSVISRLLLLSIV